MTIKQSKATDVSSTETKATVRQSDQVVPPFRALGIPALAAATRAAPKRRVETVKDLPPFLQQPHNS